MVPGDFEVLSSKGSDQARLPGKAFQLKSPEVKIAAANSNWSPSRVMEQFTEASRWVKDAWRITAGRFRTGRRRIPSRCEKIIERATEDVRIDGNKIHLG